MSRRRQLITLIAVGITMLGAAVALGEVGAGGATGIRFSFAPVADARGPRDPAPAAGAPTQTRAADSVDAFTKKYGDPPDANRGRLRIPSISVNAPLSYRAVRGDTMPDPSGPTDIAYYDMSGFAGMGGTPGQGGNSILGGHVDLNSKVAYAGNAPYDGPGVLWSLSKVRPGDVVELDYRGVTYKYVISTVQNLSATTADWAKVWSNNVTKETITLFTCGGTFNPATHEYSDRLVVRAERA